MMAQPKIEKYEFSSPVYGYVPKPMKWELDELRKLDPNRYSNSQIIEDALGHYLPLLKAQLGVTFKMPTHETPSRRRKGKFARA